MAKKKKGFDIKEYFSSGKNKQLWEEAKEDAASRSSGQEDFDDGKYEVKVISATINESESSGRVQSVIGFKFLNGDYKGKTVYSYQGIENNTGLSILIGTLKRLGYEIDDPEDLEEVNEKITKEQPHVLLRIKTNGEFQNKIVLKKLDEDEESADSEEEEEDEDDDTDDSEADESEKPSKEDEDSDDDDDEDGEETSEKEDSEDDEDEKEEEDEKPKKKPKAEPEEEDTEKVELEVGTRVKIQHNKEVQKAKIVRIDEDNQKVKVKLSDGEKIWIPASEIIDVIA